MSLSREAGYVSVRESYRSRRIGFGITPSRKQRISLSFHDQPQRARLTGQRWPASDTKAQLGILRVSPAVAGTVNAGVVVVGAMTPQGQLDDVGRGKGGVEIKAGVGDFNRSRAVAGGQRDVIVRATLGACRKTEGRRGATAQPGLCLAYTGQTPRSTNTPENT